jgi:hypothetical protein
MRLPSILLVISFAATMTGCSALSTSLSPPKTGIASSESSSSDAGVAKVDLIFEPDEGQPQRIERSLSDATTVQQFLTQNKAGKKYRRFSVEIHRLSPAGSGYFTIPCEYDRATRQIDPVNDYSLMPGDKVVVKEDTTTVFDDMLQGAGGTLGKRFTTGGKHKTGPKFRVEG